MGLDKYYRRSIQGYPKIDHPITSLQKKGVNFLWMLECVVTFQQLKYLLTYAYILKIIDLNKDFKVYTNSYKEGIIGFLMQEGILIYYQSRKLNQHDHHYVTHHLELATILHTLKMWRNYLLGRMFLILKNHRKLRYLSNQTCLNVR